MAQDGTTLTRALVADVASEVREKLPVFYGTDKDEIRAGDLCDRIDAQHALRGGSENGQVQMLYTCLRGAALEWFKAKQDTFDRKIKERAKVWTLLKKDFLYDFDRARTDLNAVTYGHPKQKKDETASAFLNRLSNGYTRFLHTCVEHMKRKRPDMTDSDDGQDTLENVFLCHVTSLFIDGIEPDLRTKMKCKSFANSMQELIEDVIQAENELRRDKQLAKVDKGPGVAAVGEEGDPLEDRKSSEEEIAAMRQVRSNMRAQRGFQNNRNDKGQFAKTNTVIPNRGTGNGPRKCFGCGSTDHLRAQCPRPRVSNNSFQTNNF